jgi:hypothetical protein
MQFSRRFPDPANDELAFTITEATNPAGKVSRKPFLPLVERQQRQRPACNVLGQPGNVTAAAPVAGPRRHERRQCRNHTRKSCSRRGYDAYIPSSEHRHDCDNLRGFQHERNHTRVFVTP